VPSLVKASGSRGIAKSHLPADSVDLAVVGCGVAGPMAALTASEKGISVALLEEHREVGVPSHCSGHVGISGFRKFGPPVPKAIIENEIKGAVLFSPGGRELLIHKPSAVTWVLNRAELDRHLANLATNRGAELHLGSRVESLKRDEDGFLLNISGSNKRAISCRMLIDASGCSSSISRYAGLSHSKMDMLVNSAQFNVENLSNVDSDFVEVYFGQRYAPGFFGWIIPRRDGTAKVGIAARAPANVRECFKRFVTKHPIASPKLRHTRTLAPTVYHPIPIGGASNRTFADSILVVGDAASQVKPTTGGGIVFGLACGRIAGETAAKAIESRKTSDNEIASYETRWRKLLGFDLKAMTWLRRLLYNLPDPELDSIFRVSQELKADQVLNRTSDIDFQGRTLFSLARDPRLLITFLSASFLSAPSLLAPRAGNYREPRDDFPETCSRQPNY